MSTKNILIVLFITLVHIGFAQDYKLYVSPTITSNGIQLKWLSKMPLENGSFNIYRKESGSWTKINTTPITASVVVTNDDLKSPRNPFPNDSDYAFYIQLKNDAKLKASKNADFYLYFVATMDNKIAKHVGIYFLDNTAVNGKSYTYKLTQSISEKELAVSETIVFKSFGKMTAPRNITIKAGDGKLEFSWFVNDNFIGYNIYKSDAKNNFVRLNDKLILIDNGKFKSDKLFTDDKLENGKSYSYKISGIDYFGNESELSLEITGIPVDNVAPHSVRNIQANIEKNNIVLQWKPSSSTDVKGYTIFKSTKDTNSFSKLNTNLLSSKDTVFIDKDASVNGSNILYYIESVDANNNSSKSQIISAFIPDHIPPAMPKDAVSKVVEGKVSISWTKNTESDLAGYRVYRGLKDDEENSLLLLNSKPRKETTFVDTFPKKTGTKFIYKIRAIDNSFNESEPSVVIAQLPDVMPPSAPVLTDAKFIDNKVILKWNAAPDDDIKGYNILRKNEKEREFVSLNTTLISAIEKLYEDKSITKNISYQYAVQSVDNAGNISLRSNSILVKPSITTLVNTNTVNLTARYDKANKQVILNYMPDDKNDNIEGYVIFRKMEKTNPKQLFTPNKTGNYTDKKTEEDKTYLYFLKAVFVNGDMSDASESVKVETK